MRRNGEDRCGNRVRRPPGGVLGPLAELFDRSLAGQEKDVAVWRGGYPGARF
ncbi:MAG: hypothetical protein JRF54_09820 [Deltaproteobacteria bacterium]|nr:hypothetical protein [Deltaproteobacteria bacterium]